MSAPLSLIFTDEQGVEYSLAQGTEPAATMTPRTRALAIALVSTALNELAPEDTDDQDNDKPAPLEPEVQSKVRFASDA